MKTKCPHCGQKLEAGSEWEGQDVDCPACHQVFVFSALNSEAPEARPVVVARTVEHHAAASSSSQRTVPAQAASPERVRAQPHRRSTIPATRVKTSSGGGSAFFVAVALLAGIGFGYAWLQYHETPRQVWQHLLASFANGDKPLPSLPREGIAPPAATPAPVLADIPPAPPAPEPAPTATPPPTPDPLAWIVEHKEYWPKEVVINQPTEFPAVLNGKIVGSATVAAGSLVQLVAIEAADLAVVYNGGGARLPVAATDLRQRAEAQMARAEVDAARAVAQLGKAPATAKEQVTAAPAVVAAASGGTDNLAADTQSSKAGAFVHPGLLHSEEDLQRMRTHKERGPWKDGWEKLIANRHASLGYKPRPVQNVVRGRDRLHTAPENYPLLFNDIAAAYACALRWRISGDRAYAEKSIEIMNAWSSTLEMLSGSTDAALAAGIYGYEFANAAEIMRTYKGWKPDELARFQKMMLTVFLPMNQDFLKRHNNTRIDHYWANWDLCNMASMMAIGVLCDKRSAYEEVILYFKNGKGMGAVKNAVYFVHPGGLGQWQEAGRDQGHTTMGIGLMGAICEMAWKQGDDLYGYDNNRFLAGCEYVAKYNLGEDVPFKPYSNDKVTQTVISDGARGGMRPVWDLVYNHYVKRKGLAAPYTTRMAEKARPEGGGGDYGPNSGGFDQLGYGTLTATLDMQELHKAAGSMASWDIFKKPAAPSTP